MRTPDGRFRASRACQACASSKVKCDVSQKGPPCTKCANLQRNCTVLPTKRGKYCRQAAKSRQSSEKADSNLLGELPALNDDLSQIGGETEAMNESVPQEEWNLHIDPFFSGPSFQLNPPMKQPPSESAASASTLVSSKTPPDTPEQRDSDAPDYTPFSQRQDEVDTTENSLWVNLLNASSQAISQESSGPASAYVPEVYSVTHVVRNYWAENYSKPPEDGSLRIRVHYPEEKLFSIGSHRRIPNSIPAMFESSTNESINEPSTAECMALPDRPVADELVAAFFEMVHRNYPLFDRRDFASAYVRAYKHADSGMELCLIFSVLALGSQICSMETLRAAGFISRLDALATFSTSASKFYKATSSKSKISVIQTSFLLGLIWMSPDAHSDTYWYVGQADSVALSMGMHRSTASSKMPLRYQSLYKRIFWCCYIRDRHSAASTGRPYRILDTFCDVELPDESDFEYSVDDANMSEEEKNVIRLCRPDDSEVASFFIAHAKLAKILTGVVECVMSPGIDSETRSTKRMSCLQQLHQWKEELPPSMCHYGNRCGKLASDLHLSYNAWVMHLCRSEPGRPPAPTTPHASEAAGLVVRLLEDLVATNTIRFASSQIIPALLATMAQLVQDRQYSATPSAAKLAVNKLHLILIAAREMANSQPTAGWCLKLFLGVQASAMNKLKQKQKRKHKASRSLDLHHREKDTKRRSQNETEDTESLFTKNVSNSNYTPSTAPDGNDRPVTSQELFPLATPMEMKNPSPNSSTTSASSAPFFDPSQPPFFPFPDGPSDNNFFERFLSFEGIGVDSVDLSELLDLGDIGQHIGSNFM